MKNAEVIKNMTTWDLAEFIHDVSNGTKQISTCNADCSLCSFSEAFCISNIAEWLMDNKGFNQSQNLKF